jgi:DNA-binding winged helix-turn-helix (wHTH) protein/Tol biopolymer transport system component
MTTTKHSVFRFSDVEVREREFALVRAGETLAVEPKAFRVLLILLRNPGKLIPKQELLDAVWGDAAVTENSLARAVALLRKLLGDGARTPRFIETVATVGYRFVSPVEAVEDPAAVSGAPGPDPPAEAGAVPAPVPSDANRSARRNQRRWLWAAGAAAIILLGAACWYVSRPLPPPRITAYTQITHDGHGKLLGGTDGSRLYFTQFSPNFFAQVGVNGGEIAQLPITIPGAPAGSLWDVAPDGSNGLVGTGGVPRIWIVPLIGGSARHLVDGTQDGEFSPDGASVIYGTRDGGIYTVRIDGTGKRMLAHVDSPAEYFSWSPDGRAIRFDVGGLLWEMSPDGSGIHRLLPDWKEPGLQTRGRWTPDGSFFLFHLYNSHERSELWALDERHGFLRPRPSGPIRLTTGPIRWGAPIPSRDGTKIFVGGFVPRGELSRIDLKTGGTQPFLGGISVEFVSFSPDGKSVAYVLFPEGTLWKANRDGSDRMELGKPPESAGNPRWSPDSKQILFNTASSDSQHSAINLVSADGGVPQRLLPGDPTDMHDANWSPDGKRVLFAHGAFPSANEDLRILDLDSGQVTVVPGSSNMWSPRWSPDGRYILAMYNEQRRTLPIFDFKTGQWSTLSVGGDGEVDFPSFSRDSRAIYFLRLAHDQGVFRIPVTGGNEQRVVDMTDIHLTGYFGFSMSLDPTDAPLVLRDVGSDDIYALTLEP